MTVQWLIEFIKLVGILFIMLLAYSIINVLILEAAGGFEVFGESGLMTVFFLLQTGGILALVTVYYRNKMLLNPKLKLPDQEPLSRKWTRILLFTGAGAVAASYAVLIGAMVTS
ncbi:hypothetical protein [Alkalicoccus saliphilus]|jgi:hypothetical protein|uniref:hypothetical protein n=1 Tax=Alkalicoccus saliphilus TaxID=200989 RepID=UPI000D1DB5ED|nr:hypothetical protein [Alkalicoccus saliphilus]